jgi:ParB-like chromosome segregation protein Spo0J
MKELTKKQLEKLLPVIELVPIDDIKLNPDNPRTITDRKFKSLVKSLTEFWQMLFLRPIILDEDGFALGGNMRTLAGQKAGFKYLPCIKADKLTIQQRREFVIKDNLPFGDWNFESLANDWDAKLLTDWGFDLPGMETVSFQTKPKAPVYDITLKAATESDQEKLVERLKAAGFEEEKDYVIE